MRYSLQAILTFVSHQAEFLWRPRGFESVEEMNEAIVERWNKTVAAGWGYIVYHLGDMCLTNTDAAIPYIQRLNGNIRWIKGNHDSDAKVKKILVECHNVELISPYEENAWAYILKDGKRRFYLSHYPTLTANFDDKHFSQHVINLHGHTHQQKNWLFPDNPFTYHVGLDSHNCTPVHIDEILADIRNRWNGLHNQVKTIEDWYGIPGELRLEHP